MTQIKINARSGDSNSSFEVASGVLGKQVIDAGSEYYFSPRNVSKRVLVLNTDISHLDEEFDRNLPQRQYFDLVNPDSGQVVSRQVCWMYVQPPLGQEKIANHFGFLKTPPETGVLSVEAVRV